MNEIAFTGDIEKAFLNVSVDPSNRYYLRFLWVDDVTSRHPNIQVYRFARDAFHVSSSPFLLNATIRHHLTSNDISREFADKVLKSLYVASFVGGDVSDNCVFEMYKELKSSFIDAGFSMRKWVSNSAALQERIKDSEEESPQVCQIQSKSVEGPKVQEEDETFASSLFESAKNPSTEKPKVLDIGWDNHRVLLSLDSRLETINNGTITKGAILGATSNFYDPLGLLSPAIILSKIIFQNICKSKMVWEDPVHSFLYEKWLKLVQDTRKVGVVELKRHCFRGPSSADL